MTLHITLDTWLVQKVPAREVRMQVFVIEQNIPIELEWDDMDEVCLHAVAYDAAGNAVGTGRLLPDGHIGRMAVLASVRGNQVGSKILLRLMQAARDRGDQRVELSAQRQAEGFYQAHGFNAVGEPYFEAGIPHVSMEHSF